MLLSELLLPMPEVRISTVPICVLHVPSDIRYTAHGSTRLWHTHMTLPVTRPTYGCDVNMQLVTSYPINISDSMKQHRLAVFIWSYSCDKMCAGELCFDHTAHNDTHMTVVLHGDLSRGSFSWNFAKMRAIKWTSILFNPHVWDLACWFLMHNYTCSSSQNKRHTLCTLVQRTFNAVSAQQAKWPVKKKKHRDLPLKFTSKFASISLALSSNSNVTCPPLFWRAPSSGSSTDVVAASSVVLRLKCAGADTVLTSVS